MSSYNEFRKCHKSAYCPKLIHTIICIRLVHGSFFSELAQSERNKSWAGSTYAQATSSSSAHAQVNLTNSALAQLTLNSISLRSAQAQFKELNSALAQLTLNSISLSSAHAQLNLAQLSSRSRKPGMCFYENDWYTLGQDVSMNLSVETWTLRCFEKWGERERGGE